MRHPTSLVVTALLLLVACGGAAKDSDQPAAPPSEPTPAVEPAPVAEPAAPTPDPAAEQARLAEAEQATLAKAQPVLEAHCAKCHRSGKKAKAKTLAHFSMDTYPFTGHHADEMGE